MAIDPYNRILQASKKGKEVRLKPKEVMALASNHFIQMRAEVISGAVENWYSEEL